jgi:hypothetical protein
VVLCGFLVVPRRVFMMLSCLVMMLSCLLWHWFLQPVAMKATQWIQGLAWKYGDNYQVGIMQSRENWRGNAGELKTSQMKSARKGMGLFGKQHPEDY